MMAPQIVRLKDYELVCGATAVDGGKFEPTLVISSNTWPSRPRNIAVRAGAFATEAIAMASAQTQGVEWIANFGKRLSAPPANPRQVHHDTTRP